MQTLVMMLGGVLADLNGHGLAAALVGRPHWLPLEQEPIVFEQVTFNLQGHAPYPRLQRMLALKPQVSSSDRQLGHASASQHTLPQNLLPYAGQLQEAAQDGMHACGRLLAMLKCEVGC